MVAEGTEALQVALSHLFFNVTGVVIFYVVPVSLPEGGDDLFPIEELFSP